MDIMKSRQPTLPTETMVVVGFEAVSAFQDTEAYKKMSGCEGSAESARVCWAAMVAELPAGQSPAQDIAPSDAALLGIWEEATFAKHEPESVIWFARELRARYGQAAQPSVSTEPVAWAFNRPGEQYKSFTTNPEADNLKRDELVPLYAAPTPPADGKPQQEELNAIYDAFGICSAARESHILMENISNVKRRSECLRAIEREFFTVPGVLDGYFPGEDPGEECLLNWGASPDEYVTQFGKALDCIRPAQQGADKVDAQESPTKGMSLGERIAHVGGRNNAQGYIEFGSPMAIDALIQRALRDMATAGNAGAFQARYRLKPDGVWSSWGHVVCGVKGHEQELRYLPNCRPPSAQPDPAMAEDRDSQIQAALSTIRQDYGPDFIQSASPRDYVENAVMQLIDAGYRRFQPASGEDVKDAEIARLNAIVNTPQSGDFLRAVSTEAEHQRQRWGASGDVGKTPADWFWLVGYLAGKALHAHSSGDTSKAEHHIITTAAACFNWHATMFGKTDMRPGTDAAMQQGGQS